LPDAANSIASSLNRVVRVAAVQVHAPAGAGIVRYSSSRPIEVGSAGQIVLPL